MSSLTDRERNIRQRLKNDFEHYAPRCLKVRTKAGEIQPFVLNEAQRIIHQRFQDQIDRTGRVRALILKARQMGSSTYVGGRFYWKTSHAKGMRAFILTHKDSATQNLFAMTKRFYENCPPVVRPELKSSNATELDFGKLDSGYRIGTAKADGVGRSDTIQLFHGSEVAFWHRADQHATGVLQAIADVPGTESVLESTANGVGGLFYNMCMEALRGDSDYELIFLPWFVMEEYAADPAKGWEAPQGIAEYAEIHELSERQTYWLFRKNRELALADGLPTDEICWKFRQEYPSTPDEAFQVSGEDSFIPPVWVQKARKFTAPNQDHAPLVLGVDVARGGGDNSRIMERQGRVAGIKCNLTINVDDLMVLVGMIIEQIDRLGPDAVFVDSTGLGSGVCDRLKELGYGRIVHAVNFGNRASAPDKYRNKRAEMWGRMRDWFMDEAGVTLRDDDEIQRDIVAPQEIGNSVGAIQLEAKRDIKKRLGFSPDAGDALALTFAQHVGGRAEKPRWNTAIMDDNPFD